MHYPEMGLTEDVSTVKQAIAEHLPVFLMEERRQERISWIWEKKWCPCRALELPLTRR